MTTTQPAFSPRQAVRGLKDRKGRQVYEGDRIKVYDPVDRVLYDNEAFEVFWKDSDCAWWMKSLQDPLYSYPLGLVLTVHFAEDEKNQVEIQ